MSVAHYLQPTVPEAATIAVRLGAGNTPADNYDFNEVGKIVKLGGESAYVLAAAGNDIEGFIGSIEGGLAAGFTVGGVQEYGRQRVTFDGAQADGTGVIAIGDIVVAAPIVAKGTPLTGYPKVRKATTPANCVIKWRVVSRGPVGTGAVGTVGVIARI